MSNVFADFMVNSGLYERMTITGENERQFIDLVYGKVNIDVYCTKCQEKRIFAMEPIQVFLGDTGNEEIRSLGDILTRSRDLYLLHQSFIPEKTDKK